MAKSNFKMGKEFRYVLEIGSKKHLCPQCGKKRFVRYIDKELSQYLPSHYGRCDRESKCGYFKNPYKDDYAKAIWSREQDCERKINSDHRACMQKPLKRPKIAFVPNQVLDNTRSGYDKNIFIQNLLFRIPFPFKVEDLEKVISLYHLGTIQNGYREGSITFPFIDLNNNVRVIQVKSFDENNCTTGTDFLHSIIEKYYSRKKSALPSWLEAYKENDKKVSCMFGEHLLQKYRYNPVALVEAPKTAIYASLYFGFPEETSKFLWLAVYNLSSLSLNKCRALQGRKVYLFPDLSKDGSAFALWDKKGKEIQQQLVDTYFQTSNLLEENANQDDKTNGKDIADYLITMDWRYFRRAGKEQHYL